ncbi:putative receptor-like protein kinase At4g00960 [Quercus lobata]|uniref:putative receptor-like protein kinase At4g00960 n=1 Tax=Quercus lobata TaxID=97700 RepID=UPI001248A175|nr:putative receptor-like protein kinase At4g00960 [Quercus lobata]
MSLHNSQAFLLPSFVLFVLTSSISSLLSTEIYHKCTDGLGSNEPSNENYRSNLTTLLDSFSSKTFQNYTFDTSSNGGIYGLFLCRGDLSNINCQNCVKVASNFITSKCPLNRSAIVWNAGCMLRYSDFNFFGVSQTQPQVFLWNSQNETSPEEPNFDATSLMFDLVGKALETDMLYKSGEGFSVLKGANDPGYGLVQCTKDINITGCRNCLYDLMGIIANCCRTRKGFTIFAPSCNLRFEIFSFFETARALPSPPSGNVAQMTSVESLQFDFGTIRAATDNFSDANKLGRGGFGEVHRGRLFNGQEIAVKRLSRNSGQGDLEFKNEVLLVAKLQHRSLVRLLGFCLEGSERLLIYEFVPNTSLDHYIFDPIKRANLDWEMRYKIIRGIARGILYLHEDSRLRIIHRDLKAGNILLDAKMNPKIADFGMARMFVSDETEGNTNRIVGTYGYMAPEYAMFGQFSIKSDVFSFGVLILEIVSGQKNTSFHNGENMEYLLNYAWKNWREGTISNLIDPTLNNSPISEILRCIHIGLLCVQQNVDDRPNMTLVGLMMNSNTVALPVPTQPASFTRSNVILVTSLQPEIGSPVTNNEVSITELYPR